MISFILSRLLQALLVMLIVTLIAFSLFRYVGDPVLAMVGQQTSAAERERLRVELGLDDPVIVQFGRFVANATLGDLGISYRQKRPVLDMLVERLPATLELSIVSSLMALVLGIAMGVYSALHRDSWTTRFIQVFSLVGISLPPFLVGILLIFAFSVGLGWLPSSGRGEVVQLGWWSTGLLTTSGLAALVMPATTLALYQITLIVRLVRAEMLWVIKSDYIRFARARGLTDRAVNLGHALRNTLVPVITIAGLQLGSVIAFAIVTETVFQWPGMGYQFIQAVMNVDLPVMAAYLVFVALVFVIINLIVDLLYYVIDPRLESNRGIGGGHPG
ncbi:MAG: ABC transporter permease [Hyphomicrobiaceae bacterium]